MTRRSDRHHELLMANPGAVFYIPDPLKIPNRIYDAKIVGYVEWDRWPRWRQYNIEYETSTQPPKTGPWIDGTVTVTATVDGHLLHPRPTRP